MIYYVCVWNSSLGWTKKIGCLKWLKLERVSVEKNGRSWKRNTQQLKKNIWMDIASHQRILSHCFTTVLVLLLMMIGTICYCINSSRTVRSFWFWSRPMFVFVCRIEFANKAGDKGIALDWALGAFILNTDTTTSAYSGRSRKMLGWSYVSKYIIWYFMFPIKHVSYDVMYCTLSCCCFLFLCEISIATILIIVFGIFKAFTLRASVFI